MPECLVYREMSNVFSPMLLLLHDNDKYHIYDIYVLEHGLNATNME